MKTMKKKRVLKKEDKNRISILPTNLINQLGDISFTYLIISI